MSTFSIFLKERRKTVGLTQEELASKAGVGLRFVRDLEQEKKHFGWTRLIRCYPCLAKKPVW